MANPKRAIITVSIPKESVKPSITKQMYAILRRYTPEVRDLGVGKCTAELTGLRTFFKMTYKEMTEAIVNDLKAELPVSVRVKIGTEEAFDGAKVPKAKIATVSTYDELNPLFTGDTHFTHKQDLDMRKRLSVPFIGVVE